MNSVVDGDDDVLGTDATAAMAAADVTNDRPSALTTPADTEPAMPSGLPTATTS